MYAEYKTDIGFSVVQRTLLWQPINFGGIFADVKIDRLHSLLSCFETKCTIALRMCALLAPLFALHRMKVVKIGPVVSELKWGRK